MINLLIDEIQKGENKYIEFKEELPQVALRYVKTLIAFANTSGGKLIIGVEDSSRKVVGVHQEDVFKIMDAVADAVTNMVYPQLVPDISFQSIGDKTVVVIEIYPGNNRPYFIKGAGINDGTYIRVAGTTRLADEFTLQELILQGRRLFYDEQQDLSIEYSDKVAQKLCKDIMSYRAKNNLTPNNAVTVENLLNWKLLIERDGNIYPTNAFNLLTKNNFRFAKIQCAVFKGNDRVVFIDKRVYEGSLYEQIEEAFNFVLRNIHLGAKIEGLYRKEQYELPPEALREAIINAVCHRNYMLSSCIQVAIFDDRVEITSPGALYGSMRVELLQSGRSQIRNHAIADIFSRMGIIEQWGTGVKRIFDYCREYGVREPEFIDFGDGLRINFYRNSDNISDTGVDVGINTDNIGVENGNVGVNVGIKNVDVGINVGINQEKLLCIIKEHPNWSAKKIADNVKVTSRTVERLLHDMKEKGIIVREGARKNGKWLVIESK